MKFGRQRYFGGQLSFAVLLCLFSGCLDSNNDGDDESDVQSDSGSLDLSVSPDSIQVDNLAFVDLEFSEIQFDDIESEGLTFKFALPEEFQYVANSAVFITEQGAVALVPAFTGTVEIDDDVEVTYVIFSFSGEDLAEVEEGHIQFDLKALDVARETIVAVDLDRGSGTFDVEHAEFDAEVEVTLVVSPVSVD